MPVTRDAASAARQLLIWVPGCERREAIAETRWPSCPLLASYTLLMRCLQGHLHATLSEAALRLAFPGKKLF